MTNAENVAVGDDHVKVEKKGEDPLICAGRLDVFEPQRFILAWIIGWGAATVDDLEARTPLAASPAPSEGSHSAKPRGDRVHSSLATRLFPLISITPSTPKTRLILIAFHIRILYNCSLLACAEPIFDKLSWSS
jgi:hypothetical protein